jgi:RNA polymerase sigma-70 factor (ECF subfamily)
MDGKASFEEIYERFHPGILRFLSRLVGADEAEDVAQEVFLRVDRGLAEFRGESSIGTWVYRIARNAALDLLRSRPAWHEGMRETQTHGSEENPSDAVESLPDGKVSIERHLIGKEMSECIRSRVDSLPESYRRVLVLRELAGMTNAAIASALGIGEGAVKIRLHRARARLREDLGTHCTLCRDERDELVCEPKPGPRQFRPVSFSAPSSSVESKTGR